MMILHLWIEIDITEQILDNNNITYGELTRDVGGFGGTHNKSTIDL